MEYTRIDLFWIFIVYSFAGWCAGVVANAMRRKRFINTGFLNLPLCPVYGVIGAGLLYLSSGIEAQDLLPVPGRSSGGLSGDRYYRRDPGESV